MRPLQKGRGGRGEANGVGLAIREARRFKRQRQCVLIPACDGAKACAAAAKPGEFQRSSGGGAIKPQQRRVCAHGGDASVANSTPLHLDSSFPPSVVSRRTLDSFRRICKYVYQRDHQSRVEPIMSEGRAIMSMDIFRDDALKGKSILVTGGGSGLGKEIGKALAAKGAKVHICGRRPQVLEDAAAEISAQRLSGGVPARLRHQGRRPSRGDDGPDLGRGSIDAASSTTPQPTLSLRPRSSAREAFAPSPRR